VEFNGLEFAAFMAPGILAMTSVYTASFEATYGTFVRSRYQQTYDAMRATPLTVDDVFTGELLWCSTKGMLFATIVGLVLLLFGKVLSPWAVLIPIFGFLTAMLFAGISFVVTSMVQNMNHFQFYFTIGLTPLVYFSGMMFPVQELPGGLAIAAYSTPMFHVIESFRLIVSGAAHLSVGWAWICPGSLLLLALIMGRIGVRCMMRRTLG
jgi:lipooligosaccharide transport system permease protein